MIGWWCRHHHHPLPCHQFAPCHQLRPANAPRKLALAKAALPFAAANALLRKKAARPTPLTDPFIKLPLRLVKAPLRLFRRARALEANCWPLTARLPADPVKLRVANRRDVKDRDPDIRSEEHTSELQSLRHLVCRL